MLFFILIQRQEREFAMASRLVRLLGHSPAQGHRWRLAALHWAGREFHKLRTQSSLAVSPVTSTPLPQGLPFLFLHRDPMSVH